MTRWAISADCGDEDYPQNCPESGCSGLVCKHVNVWVYDPGFIDADDNGGLDLFITEDQVRGLELRVKD